MWSLRAGYQSSTPIPGPHPSAAPSTLWAFEGVGNGTFFWLKGKLSLGPLVLREAVGKGSDEGRQRVYGGERKIALGREASLVKWGVSRVSACRTIALFTLCALLPLVPAQSPQY